MSEHDLSRQDSRPEDREEDEGGKHPLEAGIDAAKNGDTMSLEEIFLDSSDP